MNAPPEDAVPLLSHYQTEWRALKAERLNVLIEGPTASTRAVLDLLEPHIRTPIVRISTRAALQLPGADAGGVILEEIAALSETDQSRLLVWLGDAGRRAQVVSTTKDPLFPRLATGRFDPTLYYRLNVLLLRVPLTDESGIGAGDCEEKRSQDSEPTSTSQSV